MTKVAINGLGRIGRATLKILMDTPDLNLVAANDIGTSESVEYLLRWGYSNQLVREAARIGREIDHQRARRQP